MSGLKPRKHPTQPRAVETVACILEAAAQILEVQGFEAFNTNAVAERAGVSIGSLYQYFPGKKALLIALMQREKERFRDDAFAALAETTGRAAMQHLIQAAVRQQLGRAELARLLDLEEEKPETRQALEGKSGFNELIRRVLDMPGLPPQGDTAHAADDVGQLIRALTDAAGLRGDHDAVALEKRIVAAVFGYLGAAQM